MTSPDLISPHASKGAAVQMTATLQTAELVGTHNSSVLRLHDNSSHSSGVASTTKTGFDATVGFGGNIGVPNKVGGQVGATLGYSARTAESVNAGTNTSHKSGIQIKGDTGLYKVTAEVEIHTPTARRSPCPSPPTCALACPRRAAWASRCRTAPREPRPPRGHPASPRRTWQARSPRATSRSASSRPPRGAESGRERVARPARLRELPAELGRPERNPRSSKGKAFVRPRRPDREPAQADHAAVADGAEVAHGQPPRTRRPGPAQEQGLATNTYVNVTVKAKVTDPVHLGQADARNVRDAASTGPKLDSSTTHHQGLERWRRGQGRHPRQDRWPATPTPTRRSA